jgi:DNA-binding ferritin-like protein
MTSRPWLQAALSVLQAQYMLYQHYHWTSSGHSAYGNHLLFQRLYESVQEDVDGMAEKIIALMGGHTLNPHTQALWVSRHIKRWTKDPCPFRSSLSSESDLQDALRIAYDGIKSQNSMTLGLDDFIMATASKHETNQYLLHQILQEPNSPRVARLVNQKFTPPPAAVAPAANAWFFPNPEFRETREFVQSKALSNDIQTATSAAKEMDVSVRKEKKLVDKTPPTPTEIVESNPLAPQLSTLSRLVLDTTEVEGRVANWNWNFSAWGV